MAKVSIFFAAILFCLFFGACSQCYECTTKSEITDEDGNVIDTTENIDDFCTASQQEVKEREDEGAECRSI